MLPANTQHVRVYNHVLNPAEAEIWITVPGAELHSDYEIRGRLVGPRCLYATTVEIAYPSCPLREQLGKPTDLTARVIIPEPSLWDPESPFLYQGSIEVWKDGCCRFEARISHGLRGFQLGARALRCNGRALMICGLTRQQLSVEAAVQLRREGYNTLVTRVSTETASLWDAADRFGFLVLGRLPDLQAALRQAESLKFHASCLGWLLPEDVLEHEGFAQGDLARLQNGDGQLLGAELNRRPPESLPQEIQFIFAEENLPAGEAELHRPVLVKTRQTTGAEKGREQALMSSGILGCVAE